MRTANSFDANAWKRDKGDGYKSIRSSMIDDFERQYPVGSSRQQITSALGGSEGDFADICREDKAADSCQFYYVGESGVDPIVFVVSMKQERTIGYRRRVL